MGMNHIGRLKLTSTGEGQRKNRGTYNRPSHDQWPVQRMPYDLLHIICKPARLRDIFHFPRQLLIACKALFEPISNVLLKRMKPSIYIPVIMVLWGICMTFMGFVKDFSGLMAARWYVMPAFTNSCANTLLILMVW